MNTLNFLDANVFMALLWSRHVHSERARQWFQQISEERVFYCRITQLSVLRLLTTEQVMGDDTKTMAQAWIVWDRLASDSQFEFLPEPEQLETEFRARSRLSSGSPKVWADAYLLAFASTAGARFVTFDRSLQSKATDVLVL